MLWQHGRAKAPAELAAGKGLLVGVFVGELAPAGAGEGNAGAAGLGEAAVRPAAPGEGGLSPLELGEAILPGALGDVCGLLIGVAAGEPGEAGAGEAGATETGEAGVLLLAPAMGEV